jgi:hypothetical protein
LKFGQGLVGELGYAAKGETKTYSGWAKHLLPWKWMQLPHLLSPGGSDNASAAPRSVPKTRSRAIWEPHESGENEFSTLATKARDAATSKSPEVVSLLPEPAFSIEYGGHVLGRVILGHEKTIIRVGNSCKVRIEDPAISSFLINKVIGPLCSRLQAGWNIVEADGYLREIVIDKPLFGEDAVEVIKAAKWALAKAFSRPLRGWGSRRHHREMHVGWRMNEGGRMP